MRDAMLPFRESPVGCALLSLGLQPTAGLEEGMGPVPTILSLGSGWVGEPLSTLQPLRDPKVERAR